MELTRETADGGQRLALPLLLAVVALAFLAPALWLVDAGNVSWGWLVAGGLLFGAVFGVLPRTGPGRAIEEALDRIDTAVVTVGFFGLVVVVAAVAVLWMPETVTFGSFVVGGLLTVFAIDLLDRWNERQSVGEN